jgi:hypothetical protein
MAGLLEVVRVPNFEEPSKTERQECNAAIYISLFFNDNLSVRGHKYKNTLHDPPDEVLNVLTYSMYPFVTFISASKKWILFTGCQTSVIYFNSTCFRGYDYLVR